MNKKGAELLSGSWIIGLLIYFIIFISIVWATESASFNEIDSDDFRDFLAYEECAEPRTIYFPDGTSDIMKIGQSLRCDQSIGVNSQEYCGLLEGCSWNETTTGFLWWKDTYYTCIGTINYTYYGVAEEDTQTYFFGGKHIHNKYSSACVVEPILENKTLCQLFACTWTEYLPNTDANSPISVLKIIKRVFTFSYDFGMESDILALIFNIIFFVIPLLAFMFAIWFLIR